MNNYGENICGAIELLVENAIRGLQYDKSILCTITNDSKSNLGEYQVSDGSSTFTVFGDKRAYSINDEVYVLIPQGDYSQQKRITFKKEKTEEEKKGYSEEIDSIISLEEIKIEDEFGLIANNSNRNEARRIIYQNPLNYTQGNFFKDPVQYTTMGLETQIVTSFDKDIVEGNYEIFIRLIGALETGENTEKIYILESSKLFGNPYKFSVDYNFSEEDNIEDDEYIGFPQSIVFDISDFTRINQISVEIQEHDDFYYLTDSGSREKLSYEEEEPNPNIKFKNTKIIFGYNINQYADNDLALYSLSSLNYLNENPVEKNVKLNWIKKLTDNTIISISSIKNNGNEFEILKSTSTENLKENLPYLTDLFNKNLISIYWYKYLLGDYPLDPILKEPMKMMVSYFNNQHYLLEKTEDNDDIFVYESAKELENNYLDFSFQTDPNFIKEEISAAIVFNGCLLEKIIKLKENEDGYVTNGAGEYEWDEFYYTPLIEVDLDGENGIKKSFIKKCKEIFPNSTFIDQAKNYTYKIDTWETPLTYIPLTDYKKDEDGNFISVKDENGEELHRFDQNNNPVKIDTLDKENEIDFSEVKEIIFYDNTDPENPLIIAELRYTTDSDSFTPIILTSNDLEFLNLASPEEIKLNLIQEPKLDCKDDNQGIYFIYDNVLKKIQSNLFNKERNIEVSFKSFISDLIQTEPITVKWRIPAKNTMIAPPEKQNDIDWHLTNDGECYESDLIQVEEIPDVENNRESITTGKNQIFYKINEYYSSNINNNTISCIIQKGDCITEVSKELQFGTVGTNGTQYTLTLSLGKKYKINENNEIEEIDSVGNQPFLSYNLQQNDEWVEVIPVLRDNLNDQIITIADAPMTWSWRVKPQFQKKKTIVYEESQEDDEGTIQLVETEKDEVLIYKSLKEKNIDKRYFIQLPPKNNENNVITGLVGNVKNKETYFNESITSPDYSAIIQLTVKYNNINLTSYFPIPAAFAPEIQGYAGPEVIVYNSEGSNPKFNKIPSLYYSEDLLNSNETLDWWVGIVNKGCNSISNSEEILQIPNFISEDDKLTLDIFEKNYPYFSNSKKYGDNVIQLICSNFYYKDIIEIGEKEQIPISIHAVKKISVQNENTEEETVNYEYLYSQPLLILQDAFGSSFLNEWNGEYYEDIGEGIVMGSVIGAGRKDSSNKFSGVLMGVVQTDVDDVTTKNTGLYGYREGAQSFAFKDDGTAFIGTSGSGRINFDGNKGIISSGNFDDRSENIKDKIGSIWNLRDSTFKLYGTSTSKSKFIIDTTASGSNPQFALYGSNKNSNSDITWFPALYYGDNNFYIQSYDAKLDADNGTLAEKFKFLTNENFNTISNGILKLNFKNGTILAEQGFIGGWAVRESSLTGGLGTGDASSIISLTNGDLNLFLSRIKLDYKEEKNISLSSAQLETDLDIESQQGGVLQFNLIVQDFLAADFNYLQDLTIVLSDTNKTICQGTIENIDLLNTGDKKSYSFEITLLPESVIFINQNDRTFNLRSEINFTNFNENLNSVFEAQKNNLSQQSTIILSEEQNTVEESEESEGNEEGGNSDDEVGNLPSDSELQINSNELKKLFNEAFNELKKSLNNKTLNFNLSIDDLIYDYSEDLNGANLIANLSNIFTLDKIKPIVEELIETSKEEETNFYKNFTDSFIIQPFIKGKTKFLDQTEQGIDINRDGTIKIDTGYIYENQNEDIYKDEIKVPKGLLPGVININFNGYKDGYKNIINENLDHILLKGIYNKSFSVNQILTSSSFILNLSKHSSKTNNFIFDDSGLTIQNKKSTLDPVSIKFQPLIDGGEITTSKIVVYGTNTNYASNMLIQSGGNLFIGGGESPVNFYNTYKYTTNNIDSITGETLFLLSDNNIKFYTNCDGLKTGVNSEKLVLELTQGGSIKFKGIKSSGIYFVPGSKDNCDIFGPQFSNNYILLGSNTRRWRHAYVRYLTVSGPNTTINGASESGGVHGSLIPTNHRKYNLGYVDYQWKTVYARWLGSSTEPCNRIYLQNSTEDTVTDSGTYKSSGIYFASDDNHYNILRPQIRNNNCLLGSKNRRWHNIYTRYLTVSTPSTKTDDKSEPGGVASNLIPVSENLWLGNETNPWDVIFCKEIGIKTGCLFKFDEGETCYIEIYSRSGTDESGDTVETLSYLRPSKTNNVCYLGTQSLRWNTTFTRYLRVSHPGTKSDLGGPGGVWGHLIPCIRNDETSYDWALGSSSYPWKSIYGNIVQTKNLMSDGGGTASDKRIKDIQPVSILEKDLELYDNLNPVVYKYKNIFEKDNYARTHIGFIAQEVESLIQKIGLNNENCALIQKLDITSELGISQEEKDFYSDGVKYYLNYNELHGLHVLKNQKQDQEIKELKEKIQLLETRIKQLESNN